MELKKVRVQYNDQTAEFGLPKTFDDFMKLSIQKLNLQQVNMDSLSIYYKDEDDDTVVITSPYDYDQALKFLKTIDDNVLGFVFEQKYLNTYNSESESVRSGMVFDKPLNYKEEGDDKLKDEIEKMNKILEKEAAEREQQRLEKERIAIEKAKAEELKLKQIEEKKIEEERRRIEEEEKRRRREEEERLFIMRMKEDEKAQAEEMERKIKQAKEVKLSKLKQVVHFEFKKNAFARIIQQVKRQSKREALIRITRSYEMSELRNGFFTFKDIIKYKKDAEQKSKDDVIAKNEGDEQEERLRQERKERIMQRIQQKAQEEVSKSRIGGEPNEYKSALNQIKDECSTDIATKMAQYIDAQYVKMKEELIASTLKLNQNMIQTYIAKIGQVENERQSQFQVEMSKVSQSVIVSKAYPGIHHVTCNQCQRNPIQGIRYQCSQCADYNLCEICEDNNYSSKKHPHDFIRIREQRAHTQVAKPKVQEVIKGKYSYECLNKDKTTIYKKGTSINNQFNVVLLLKNNYGSTWNETKLICDKLKSSIVCSDVVVPKLAPEQSVAVQCVFNNIDVCKEGNFICFLKFNVDGNDYGEPLILTIKVEDIPMNLMVLVKRFRQQYDLHSNDLSDYKIIQALEKSNQDFEKAFASIFS